MVKHTHKVGQNASFTFLTSIFHVSLLRSFYLTQVVFLCVDISPNCGNYAPHYRHIIAFLFIE